VGVDKLTRLDFSRNDLKSADLEHILKIVIRLESYGKLASECKVLLENN
jgi:hypothetical protein